MKVRKGFVSNSSSSSYIVCVGPDEDIRSWEDDIQDAIEHWEADHEEKFPESMERVMKGMEGLKRGDYIYQWNNYETWRIAEDLFDPRDEYDPAGQRSRHTIDWFNTGSEAGFISNICGSDDARSKLRQTLCK